LAFAITPGVNAPRARMAASAECVRILFILCSLIKLFAG
jgi:hypothetical protein